MITRKSEKDRISVFFHSIEVIGIFRVNDLIDLPVVDSISGQRLCTVKDIIIDMRESRVYALVCKQKFLKRSMDAIPYRHIASISQNSVLVTGRPKQINSRKLNARFRRFQSYQCILGKLVQSSRGEILGIIRDLVIDTKSGIVKGYELSEGYLDDFLTGRHIMKLEYGHTLTGKNMVLRESCENPWYN